MSTQLDTLLNAVTVAGAGSIITLTGSERYQGGDHTVEVSGTFVGTVAFEGRIESTGAWKAFFTTTTPDVINVPGTFDAIRGNVTAYTSGSITMKCRYPLLQDLAASITTLLANQTTLLNRLTSGRATLLDNLVRLDATISGISAVAQLNDLIKQLRREGRNIG